MAKYICGLCGNVHTQEQKPSHCAGCKASAGWIFEFQGDYFYQFARYYARTFFFDFYKPGMEVSDTDHSFSLWKEWILSACKLNGTINVEKIGVTSSL